jgi:ABC-type Mn2+/Zn2+ transport system permease subunit
MALVAGPLGYLSLPGVALALVYGFDVSLGAFPFVIGGAAAIWLLEARTRLPMEALTALVFATGVAVAFLFLPVGQAEAALVGDIASATGRDAAISSGVCLGVALAVNRSYPQMVLINVSEDLATSEGIDVRKHNLLFLLLISVVVALGVKMVGGLMTAALMAIPPAAARNVGRYAFGSMAVGVVSSVLGILLAEITGGPAGRSSSS